MPRRSPDHAGPQKHAVFRRHVAPALVVDEYVASAFTLRSIRVSFALETMASLSSYRRNDGAGRERGDTGRGAP